MYLITNEGLRVLEEKGLKKILDSCFKNLDDYMISGAIYDDQIEDYAKEHKIPDLVEKVEADGFLDKRESFIIHSEIICDLLKDKIPKNLTMELRNAISSYYIYYDSFLRSGGYRGSYLWRDDNFLNIIRGDTRGDMHIIQGDIAPEADLFGSKSLITNKKTNLKGVDGYYDCWPKTLIDFIRFCCQIKKPVPFKDNWEEVFYNGNFEEEKSGSVAETDIRHLKYIKEDKEHSFMRVLPFMDDPMKHIDKDKKIFFTEAVISSSNYFSMPFIDGEDLVYLHRSKEGIETLKEVFWSDPSVRFSYGQIHHAIRGIVGCIQNYGTRGQPHDAGLIFKHFPYELYKDLG